MPQPLPTFSRSSLGSGGMAQHTSRASGRVLVIDDSPQNVLLLRGQLEREGYTVDAAGTGCEGLDLALSQPPDLILLDIMMPGLNGYEICRLLRQHDATKAVPVVVLTSLSDKADKLQALESGADDFLSKPVDRAELLARVSSLLRMRRLYEDLQKASRMKSEFLANMSHELRTPLNAIIGFSEVLLDPEFNQMSEKQRTQFQENIYRSGRHLLGLINDILDLSKVEAGRMDLRWETIQLNELILGCMAVVQPLADKKGIILDPRGLAGDASVAADPARVKQILYNLLSNAVKFTLDGGRVTVTAEISESEVRVAVRDTGIGIKPEDHGRVFEEFQQLDQGPARQQEGTGLGLALVRRLVELHGGQVWVESTPGEGSCFAFTLPMVEGAERPVEPATKHETASSEPTFGHIRDSERLTILVVEDDREAAELLTLHLTRAGYEVYRASTTDEALEMARRIQPFAVTLDVLLAGSDGWEFLSALKSDPQMANVAVIVVSIVDNREFGFALGATDYLVKPIDKNALLAILQRLDHRQTGSAANAKSRMSR
ncbi:MAG: ATP-binding response regulator [Chloroflexota bacterium]